MTRSYRDRGRHAQRTPAWAAGAHCQAGSCPPKGAAAQGPRWWGWGDVNKRKQPSPRASQACGGQPGDAVRPSEWDPLTWQVGLLSAGRGMPLRVARPRVNHLAISQAPVSLFLYK